MANVSEYQERTKEKSRKRTSSAAAKQAKPAPEPFTDELEAQPNVSLSALLLQRVRVALAGSIRWVSGYDILSSELRQRAEGGEEPAAQLLDRLKSFQATIHGDPEHQLSAAEQTLAEQDLSRAFVTRTLDRVSGKPAADEPAPEAGTPVADQRDAAAPLGNGRAGKTAAAATKKQPARRARSTAASTKARPGKTDGKTRRTRSTTRRGGKNGAR